LVQFCFCLIDLAVFDGVDLLEVLGDLVVDLVFPIDGSVFFGQDGPNDRVVGLDAEHPFGRAVECLPVALLVVLLQFLEEAVLVDGTTDDEFFGLVLFLFGLMVAEVGVSGSFLGAEVDPECLR
jgi:hypothetical protein